MKEENRKKFYGPLGLLAAFVLWTALVCLVDVQPIGPQGPRVGFAALNAGFHALTGVHMTLYVITDWLSLVPVGFVVGFAVLGAVQWIRRKKLLSVDRSILVLGGFYLTVLAVYLLFEVAAVNSRPVLINGILEASYPSSTTVLVLCVMPTAVIQCNARIKNERLKRCAAVLMSVFTVFMIVGRLVSGVHWLTDIIGGGLLSGGLVMLYAAAAEPTETE